MITFAAKSLPFRTLTTMEKYIDLLIKNKEWAKRMVELDPNFFERLVNIQEPEYLWIGCSDSRVPPNEVTQTKPGEIFIHRNVANMVLHSDMNVMSVMQYAVEVLKVKHVIVCGHYNCGGVKAAITSHSYGLINKWLRSIKDVYRLYQSEIEAYESEDDRVNKLVEFNVIEQAYHVAETSIVQKAWKERNAPHIHGWVYDLRDGIINPIFELPAHSKLPHKIYEFDDIVF